MKNIIWICLSLSFILPQKALGHKVIVFAWVEDGTVYTESSFGSKRKARDSQIVVNDADGNTVIKGRTDDKGLFSFKVPEDVNSDLHITLEAGPGHRGYWKISRQELQQSNIDTSEHQQPKQKPQESPSPIKIICGLSIIALLAAAARLLARKKRADD